MRSGPLWIASQTRLLLGADGPKQAVPASGATGERRKRTVFRYDLDVAHRAGKRIVLVVKDATQHVSKRAVGLSLLFA